MAFDVMAQQCDQCLFSKNRIVSKKRFADILRDCRMNDQHFICHKAMINNQDVCCKAFFDTQTSQQIRIAKRFNAVRFVSITAENEKDTEELAKQRWNEKDKMIESERKKYENI